MGSSAWRLHYELTPDSRNGCEGGSELAERDRSLIPPLCSASALGVRPPYANLHLCSSRGHALCLTICDCSTTSLHGLDVPSLISHLTDLATLLRSSLSPVSRSDHLCDGRKSVEYILLRWCSGTCAAERLTVGGSDTSAMATELGDELRSRVRAQTPREAAASS